MTDVGGAGLGPTGRHNYAYTISIDFFGGKVQQNRDEQLGNIFLRCLKCALEVVVENLKRSRENENLIGKRLKFGFCPGMSDKWSGRI